MGYERELGGGISRRIGYGVRERWVSRMTPRLLMFRTAEWSCHLLIENTRGEKEYQERFAWEDPDFGFR